ncbi:MAG: hypothetical protein QOI21_1623 [Actinomycetota bacterium]|jgi:hypothetical protein|nr:hypothetical protein [Actinomycetota bacterium]
MVMPNQPAPPAPPAKTPAQIAELSPQDRQQYFTDRANAGVKDDGLFGVVERMVAQANAQNDAERVGNQNVKKLESQDVEYVKGLDPSDADYMGSDHEQLKAYLDTNLDPQQVTDVSNAYHQLHEAFDGFGTAMSDAVNKSKGEWEGDAAGNAQGYFMSLSKWADANSTNAKLASETIYDQQTAASSAKNSMPEVVKFDMMDEMAKWGQAKDPLSFADAIQNTYKTYDESNKAHQEAAGVMSQYDKTLYAAASKQPAFAPPPAFGQGEVGTLNPPGKTSPTGTGNGESGNNSSSSGVTGSGSNLPSGGLGGSSGSSGSNLPGATPLQPGGPSTGSGTLPGFTAPAGYQSSNLTSTSNQNANQNTGMGGMGAMPMGGMGGMGGGMGGDSEYSSKTGRGGGGFGPGGGGSASGSGSTPGSGTSSGARPGGVGAAEAAAGRGIGSGGSGMGSGSRGSGMGGARGGKAEGEEDLEHQRPDYLVEGDPDEFFGTDMRTAPPVIGE